MILSYLLNLGELVMFQLRNALVDDGYIKVIVNKF